MLVVLKVGLTVEKAASGCEEGVVGFDVGCPGHCWLPDGCPVGTVDGTNVGMQDGLEMEPS